jgi:hypothetical protein
VVVDAAAEAVDVVGEVDAVVGAVVAVVGDVDAVVGAFDVVGDVDAGGADCIWMAGSSLPLLVEVILLTSPEWARMWRAGLKNRI